MKSYSVFHIEQKMEFEKFNCFFIDFLRYSFGRIKVISTVVEREYTPDITWQICFVYQLTGFYMIRGFTERYFLTDYSYILENHFYFVNAPDYCFKPSLITLERHISVWFLYRTGVRTLSAVIRNDTIRYDSAYYTHVNTSSSWNLKTKSPKIYRGTLIATLLNSLKYQRN